MELAVSMGHAKVRNTLNNNQLSDAASLQPMFHQLHQLIQHQLLDQVLHTVHSQLANSLVNCLLVNVHHVCALSAQRLLELFESMDRALVI